MGGEAGSFSDIWGEGDPFRGEAYTADGVSRMLRLAIAADEAGRLGLEELAVEADAVLLLRPEELIIWERTGEVASFCVHFLGLMSWYGVQERGAREAIRSLDCVQIADLKDCLRAALRKKRVEAGLPSGEADLEKRVVLEVGADSVVEVSAGRTPMMTTAVGTLLGAGLPMTAANLLGHVFGKGV